MTLVEADASDHGLRGKFSTQLFYLAKYYVGNTAPAPYPPSPLEAKLYYYGIPSQPVLVARSSANVWVQPTGPGAYHIPKESSPISSHPLTAIWEATVAPALVQYLDSKGVNMTSIDPIRMGYESESPPPVIVWIGVLPQSLSVEDGINVATHCKGILSTHNIDDVHVEIRESEVIHLACPKMYKPVPTSDATAQVREPFSTALGLSICAEDSPTIQGTGGFFISDTRNPGKIYLVTARHVLFPPDGSNELYQHCNSSLPRRNVLLFGDAAIEKHIGAIQSAIEKRESALKHLQKRLESADQMDEMHAQAERKEVLHQLDAAREAIGALKTLLADISRDWKKREERVLGHIILSPPFDFGVGEEEFTEDWAVIELDNYKIDKSNFVGNVIDLGAPIPVLGFPVPMEIFETWMYPHPTNPKSFEYPTDRLMKFHDTIPDDEMLNPKTIDENTDPCIMVIKRGEGSDLTVGRLNNIRSIIRVRVKGQLGKPSKEVCVLPRSANSGAFACRGDSGSAVIDGKGRLAGLVTAGAEASDCTYLTPVNFLLKRMLGHGLEAHLSPSLTA